MITIVRDHTAVLNAHAAFTLDIDAGFHSDGHPAQQRVFARKRSARRLVNLKTEAVAKPVAKLLAIALLRDIVPRNRVQSTPCNAAFELIKRHLLRGFYDFIDLFALLVDRSDGKGTRHVGMIAVDHAAKVRRHEIAFLEFACARHRVRHGAVGSRRDDRVKRGCFAPVFRADVVELRRGFQLTHPRSDASQPIIKALVRNALRGLKAFDLFRALVEARQRDRAAKGSPFHRHRFIVTKYTNRHRAFFKPGALAVVLCKKSANAIQLLRKTGLNNFAKAFSLCVCLNRIAKIGHKIGVFVCDKKGAVRAGKPRIVTDVFLAGDQRRVK
ncbi:hypothetical protein SDC9_101562 [bioreactor metagenome]|uniref:Uncharacterized protein n=1 Tax=bioreactor metagenome TaxID=1076179 RepID=A0A645ANG2_9ZZZZ